DLFLGQNAVAVSVELFHDVRDEFAPGGAVRFAVDEDMHPDQYGPAVAKEHRILHVVRRASRAFGVQRKVSTGQSNRANQGGQAASGLSGCRHASTSLIG